MNGKTFAWDQDYTFALANTTNGTKINNNIVFAGYGIVNETTKTNDFAGLDVKGKVVMVLDGGVAAPPAAAPGAARRGAPFNPNSAKVDFAKKNGAVGILIVSSAFPRTVATPVKSRMSLSVPTDPFFVATISDEVASALIGRTTKVAFADFKDIMKGNTLLSYR